MLAGPRRLPSDACEPVGVEAVHPDEFLLDLHDLAPHESTPLEQQAADLHPPLPLEQLLDALASAGVPHFAETVRAQSQSRIPAGRTSAHP